MCTFFLFLLSVEPIEECTREAKRRRQENNKKPKCAASTATADTRIEWTQATTTKKNCFVDARKLVATISMIECMEIYVIHLLLSMLQSAPTPTRVHRIGSSQLDERLIPIHLYAMQYDHNDLTLKLDASTRTWLYCVAIDQCAMSQWIGWIWIVLCVLCWCFLYARCGSFVMFILELDIFFCSFFF